MWWCADSKQCLHVLEMCNGVKECGKKDEKKKQCKKLECPWDLGTSAQQQHLPCFHAIHFAHPM